MAGDMENPNGPNPSTGLADRLTKAPEPSRTNVIVQMFNWRFVDIESTLPELRRIGYTYVLVSPPQKSHPTEEWWGRYQPVDFRQIDSPLGDGQALRRLVDSAHDLGLKVLVDAVLNHMADHPDYVTRDHESNIVELRYPRFSTEHFHLPAIPTDLDPIKGWAGLPDLKTESPYVQKELTRYLRMLIDDYRVDGFRLDAVAHIEDGHIEAILAELPKDGLFVFGEFITDEVDHITPYLNEMDAYDYPLARTMKLAFDWGGDLHTLVAPADAGNALPGVSAVTWVRHHDVAVPRAESELHRWDYWRIGGRDTDVDEKLALVYILGRRDGTPHVFVDHYDDDIVRAGVRFHNLALGHPEEWLVQENDQLVWQRGPNLLVAINKLGEPWRASLNTSLNEGEYLELLSGRTWTVDREGRLVGLHLEASSGAFLVWRDGSP